MNLDPSSYLLKRTPAIVQADVVKNCAWWKVHIAKLEIEVTTKAKEYREAVKEFKVGGAWRTEFKSWPECCESVLKISPQRANKLISEITEHWEEISQAPTKGGFPKHLDNASVASTSEATEPNKQTQATPKSESKPKPPMDETGEFIPQRCLDLWNNRDEPQSWMTMASELKCFVEGLGQSPNGLYSPLRGHTVTLQKSLTETYRTLELCKPYAVCYACKGTGRTKDQCPLCSGRGLISKNQWNDDWTIMGKHSEKAKEVARRAAQK